MPDKNDVPPQPLLVTHCSTSGITTRCNTHPIIPRMVPTETSINPCIPVYSLPPTIDKTYNTRKVIQVASAVVERDPARWRSLTCVPKNNAMDTLFVEWVEGKPYSK